MMINENINPELPSQSDFDPWSGCLDAISAWNHFGGLLLQEAKVKFAGNPFKYSEDFMFMGPKAFAYYLPALIDSLKTALSSEQTAAVFPVLGLGYAIQSQLEVAHHECRRFYPEILELIELVRLRMPCFCYNALPDAMAMLEQEWNAVEQIILSDELPNP